MSSHKRLRQENSTGRFSFASSVELLDSSCSSAVRSPLGFICASRVSNDGRAYNGGEATVPMARTEQKRWGQRGRLRRLRGRARRRTNGRGESARPHVSAHPPTMPARLLPDALRHRPHRPQPHGALPLRPNASSATHASTASTASAGGAVPPGCESSTTQSRGQAACLAQRAPEAQAPAPALGGWAAAPGSSA